MGGPFEYVSQRPAILQATATLGIRDSDVARIVGVVPMVVSQWATGKRPIPLVRHVALELFVVRASGGLAPTASRSSPNTPARRRETAWDTFIEWLRLAKEERGGQELPDDVWTAAVALLLQNGVSVIPKDFRAMFGEKFADDPAQFLGHFDAAMRRGRIRDVTAMTEKILTNEEQEK
jgi:DNA-binding transcriptional regulator YdaS (Cro superfamily)